MLSSRVYKSSPVPLQEALLSGRAWVRKQLREGSRFKAFLDEANATQWLGADELERYQRERLRRVLEHALRSVAYYRARVDARAKLDAASALETVQAMPLLSKEDVRAADASLISESAAHPLFKGSTSGTTGMPLSIPQDINAICRENAFIRRQMIWAGWTPGDRRAWIRGDMVVPIDQRGGAFWRMNRAENNLMMSSYHLSESNAAGYVAALESFSPRLIHAYPSSIAFLANWLHAHSARYSGEHLKGIITSSETLLPEQKRSIEATFGCRLFDWYGQFERVAAIGTCEHGSLHVLSDYSFVELLPAGDGQQEIVGTGFNNAAMPLIRYRTGDFVAAGPAPPRCACGRVFPVVGTLIGRQDSYVTLPDGRKIGRLDHIFKQTRGLYESQIYQPRSNLVQLRVVATPQFTPNEERRLVDAARQRLGREMTIEVVRVDRIARTSTGKFLAVVSDV
jgi:phenylacetate-CoA ligase